MGKGGWVLGGAKGADVACEEATGNGPARGCVDPWRARLVQPRSCDRVCINGLAVVIPGVLGNGVNGVLFGGLGRIRTETAATRAPVYALICPQTCSTSTCVEWSCKITTRSSARGARPATARDSSSPKF